MGWNFMIISLLRALTFSGNIDNGKLKLKNNAHFVIPLSWIDWPFWIFGDIAAAVLSLQLLCQI